MTNKEKLEDSFELSHECNMLCSDSKNSLEFAEDIVEQKGALYKLALVHIVAQWLDRKDDPYLDL